MSNSLGSVRANPASSVNDPHPLRTSPSSDPANAAKSILNSLPEAGVDHTRQIQQYMGESQAFSGVGDDNAPCGDRT